MASTRVPIYLDHNATTPLDPRVAEAMFEVYRGPDGNPSSLHSFGRNAKRLLEDAREAILRVLGCRETGSNERLIFTSGGTESNNAVLRGLAGIPPGRIVISAIEHPSVSETAAHLERIGFTVGILPVSRAGVVDYERLPELIDEKTRLVSVMAANHETGVQQPLKPIVDYCRPRGVRVHTDAVQAVGKLSINFPHLGIDALSLAPHKLHGPRGIGGVVLREGIPLTPILHGGAQQLGARPGTEAVALAVGMRRALEIWDAEAQARSLHLSGLRDRLQEGILSHKLGAVIIGGDVPRTPQTLCVAFPGLDRQALVLALDHAGIACATGSACASGSSEPSPVLRAMNAAPEIVNSAIRLSVGVTTTADEVDIALGVLPGVVKRLRAHVRNA